VGKTQTEYNQTDPSENTKAHVNESYGNAEDKHSLVCSHLRHPAGRWMGPILFFEIPQACTGTQIWKCTML